ncbi:FMN-binding protein [Hathewaya histolytica]|uniref:FMN-binding domain-containing protein n=1 Tax=Hathewaya histolytica TaxID=1498 RepID=A0A4U9QTL2_HATHI|nr:FMN-binding protein [Hathewaya histolytica]VTQ81772.1 FMN-binding domain-containing protein [Hathewaya histolytica]
MTKKRVLSLLVATAISLSIITGCGSKTEPKKDDTKSTAATSQYKDGKYKAEYDKADERKWKAFIEIEIKDGKIASSNFDYVNDKGQFKSKDEGYNKMMKEQGKKTCAEEFSKKFNEGLVSKQDVEKVDGVSGATHSFDDFKTLSSKVLSEKATKGDTSTLLVPAPTPSK